MKRTINAIAVFTALCVVLTTSCFAADSSTLHNSDSSQYIVTNFCIDGAERECIAEITSTPSTEPGVIAHRVSYYIPTTDDQQIETDRIISQIESGITPFAHSSQNDIFYECQFVLEILEKRDPQIIKIDGKYVDFNYIQIEEVNYGNFRHLLVARLKKRLEALLPVFALRNAKHQKMLRRRSGRHHAFVAARREFELIGPIAVTENHAVPSLLIVKAVKNFKAESVDVERQYGLKMIGRTGKSEFRLCIHE